jgi:hypothetical protein
MRANGLYTLSGKPADEWKMGIIINQVIIPITRIMITKTNNEKVTVTMAVHKNRFLALTLRAAAVQRLFIKRTKRDQKAGIKIRRN